MQIIKTTDDIPRSYRKSIFLAGPSIRIAHLEAYSFKGTWRYQACQYLEKIGYDGVVFIPEPMSEDYMKQIQWEDQCLNMADVILFWIPRSSQFPGFTTNVEYGEWMKSGKAVLGSQMMLPTSDISNRKPGCTKYRSALHWKPQPRLQ